jgi:LysM repeat protein
MLVISSLSAFGQDEKVEVERSDDKVIIGGQVYYIHIVKKGQTLYSISKAYDVSQRTITHENPDVLLGLRPEQVLKIPLVKKDINKKETRDSSKYRYHRVRKGETLFSLSRRFQVSKRTIKKNNPVLFEEELKAGQVIKIPKNQQYTSEEDTTRAKTISRQRYIFHKVKKKETLWSLAQEYGVDTSDIIGANEILQEEELQYGTVIKIPKKEQKEQQTRVLARQEKGKPDSVAHYYKQLRRYTPICDSSDYYKSNTLDVGLFLPLYIEENQERYYIDSSRTNEQGETIYKKVKKSPYYIYPGSENFIKFYEGLLLALDSLADKGVSINLKVYDTAGDPGKVKRLLSDNYFNNLDLIIGPVYERCFTRMARFARKNQIYIISPFARKNELLVSNPYVIQIYPSNDAQLEQFTSHIADYSDKNMVLVHTGDSLYYPQIRRFKNRLFSNISLDTNFADVRFKEVAFRDSIFYLKHALNKKEENIVIVPSENEAFVTDVVTNLNTLAKKGYKMRVFGYSKWQDFVNIELEYFYNINLELYTPFHVNYKDKPVKRVIKKYREMFSTEPGSYAFHGFDIGYYFFNAMYRFGKNFEKCIPYYNIPLCHSNYNFYRPSSHSGLENISLFILKYRNNLSIDVLDIGRPKASPVLTSGER